ncbi:sensor histidine kinase [Luteolibacter sp. Populi]|uniref:sensor histidine kinase n=1 Tax=Luteolibacter sp. Populi TaxID=3230487 RepID=UPI003467ACF6
MPKTAPPWAWTILVTVLLAALVAGSGLVMSKRVETIAEKPPDNRVDDAFRQMSRRITVLEGLWESALEEEAKRFLGSPDRAKETRVAGVVQCSWLNPAYYDGERNHRRFDGREPSLLPVLPRFARKEGNEWVLPDAEVISGSGWLDLPGRPPAWHYGNGRLGVLLIVDPLRAAGIVMGDKAAREAWRLASGEPGLVALYAPGNQPWVTHGEVPPNRKPDEVLRHVSRFGDWTLHRYFPLRLETSYRMPVLAGGMTIAVLLLAGGVAVAASQRKSFRIAEERVSFVNRVSHELRTPLTNLLLNTDLALDHLSVEDGRVRRRLGLIREETSRLSRIVDNVLAFARIERGKDEGRTSCCDLEKLVGELREGFAPLFERKSIVCEYEPCPEAGVSLDRDALAQILSNLLSNVEKYAGEGAKARVRLAVDEGALHVEVEDDGPGIPADARKRVFLPFERAGSRVDEGASGTGLGLAISRELAGRMGGSLELMPVAKGAKFRLRIPLQSNSAV